jgi:hypothetical protein
MVLGCEKDYPVYSQLEEDQNGSLPSCLRYAISDSTNSKILQDSFGLAEDHSCPYRVELIQYHVGKCNNPRVKSLGGDFNGYVRVEIKKGFKTIYKVQSDFKNDENRAFERVYHHITKEFQKK